MSSQLERLGIIIVIAILMIGSYFLIEDLTGLATPLAFFILFVDEMILLILGAVGLKTKGLKDLLKK
ncbi:hypothetical protein KAU33_15750 [Candidatus Dependentiae bacterium]|nr:hypothetical protein [Candidatus Dependentiae bacterium]